MSSDDVVKRIDSELTFYSAGLGRELSVPVEKAAADPVLETFQRFTQSFQPVVDAVTAAAVALQQVLAPVLNQLADAFRQLGPALRRLARIKRVYRRWNEPMLAATRWQWLLDRSVAARRRGSRWTVRQVRRVDRSSS